MKKIFLLIFSGIYCQCIFAQTITTFAGNGMAGFSGDGGPATTAIVDNPTSIALTTSGGLLIVSEGRIRKINLSGIITTIAGNGSSTYLGDGLPATATGLDGALDIATDTSGNIYITTVNNVRKINAAGIITTIAGVAGMMGYSGDGGPATAAFLNVPTGIAADNAGNVYICDANNYRVRKVNAAGIITTFAGIGTIGYSGDGFPATDAKLQPIGITIDGAGNVLISDEQGIVRKVNPASIISTYAGIGGMPGFSGDSGPATDATLNSLEGIAKDPAGNLFICDINNRRVRMVSAVGIITTYAGNGTIGTIGDGGPATDCEFIQAIGIAVKPGSCGDTVYVADNIANRIRMIVYYNHPPTFNAGHSFSLSTCASAIGLDSMLAITDSDVGQADTWAVITPAAHGTLIAAYGATAGGGVITPAGLSYTPATGYAGTDTFRVIIVDCGNVPDTATFYVRVDISSSAGTITSTGSEILDTICIGNTITLSDTATGGSWSGSNANATISGGIVSGISAGADTIRYVVSNSCGTDTATHPVFVTRCTEEVTNINTTITTLSIFPNPNDGTFTLSVISPTNEQASITIINILGEKVKQFTTTTNVATQVKMDMPEGVYFIAATTASGRWNEKVVVSERR